jgi:hypothetical protein
MVLGRLVIHFGRFVQKFNSKWIKDFNVRPETLKLLEENMGKQFKILVQAVVFLERTPKAQETKAKIDKWDYMKLKGFCI